MSTRRLQHEWRVVQNSHPSHAVFFKQYHLHYTACMESNPDLLTEIDPTSHQPLTLSLADQVAAVFPQQDIILFPTDSTTLTTWTAYLTGPPNTVYDSFRFELRIEIPPQYPHQAPKVAFLTPIFHPNIDFNTGEICLDTLKENWTPTWTLEGTLRAIHLLLSQPEHSIPLNIDAEIVLRRGDDRGYWSMARLYCLKYAIPLPVSVSDVSKQTDNDGDKAAVEDTTTAPTAPTTTTTTTTATTTRTTTSRGILDINPGAHRRINLEKVTLPETPMVIDPENYPTRPQPGAVYAHIDDSDDGE